MNTKIDQYFKRKNVKVVYNCLGHNEDLVRSYVAEFNDLVHDTNFKFSHYSKHAIYNKLYDLVPRQKMTGFESLSDLDSKFRSDISQYIVEGQYNPILKIEKNNCDYKQTYKNTLLQFVKTIDNPLLYLSGGADSEVVANAILESGVNFKVVVFEWLDNNNIVNSYELSHAYAFCKQNGIIPIIKQVNVGRLWQSEEFKKLAIDLQIQSPQLVTHAYAIEMMNYELPNVTHVFGGEVRFSTNHLNNDNSYSNIVFLDKITPLDYNGKFYSSSASPGAAVAALTYNNDGTWSIQADNTFGNPILGYWTTTPGSSYEFSVSITYYTVSGTAFVVPSDVSPNWSPWSSIGSGTLICQAAASSDGFSFSGSAYADFSIRVRVVGQTSPLATSSISLGAQAN